VPSARRASVALAVTAPVAVLLTGCVSTQTVASRARLVDARIIASLHSTQVTRADRSVSVGAPVVIRTADGDAVVVTLRNNSARQLTDLPISVGVRRSSGGTTYLNSTAALGYFYSHIAAIGPDASTKWVLTTGVRIPRGRVFATVGFPQLHPSLGHSLPLVSVSLRASRPARGGVTVKLSIVNRSVIPQYYFPVYAIALRNGREVAAGRTAVSHLGTHGTTSTSVSLLGSSRYGSLELIATPTIFN